MQSAKEIWKRALGELQIQVSKPNYNTWLGDSQGLTYQDNLFVVGVPNIFVAEWLSKRLYPLVRKTLIDITGKDVDVQFMVHNHEPLSASPLASQTDGGTSSKAIHYRFNPKYTFDNLVVSDFNRLAYAAAVEVAENPGSSYNPLFIHSGTGQGKTHLLHAIGHLTTNNGLQAAYTTAEQFANEFVSAVRENQVDKFRSKFRGIQVLLFDDVQFLVDKKQTLQCFFHTFNELYSDNRQIVITADCAPKDMEPLSNKLKSRLEGGLVVDIQPPDFETRLDILRAKTDKTMLNQFDGVLRIVAEKVCQNVRQLEGALVYLTAQAKLTGTKLTPQVINKLLTGTTSKQDTRILLQGVADHFNLSTEELIGKKRDRKTALARHIAIYLMREEHNISLTEIGRELGGRNHATILHGYEKIASELNVNPNLSAQIAQIKEKINSHKGYKKPR
ncbi:MAG: chromosomal replication initiator protein DnaA [Dehalococcoidia bacterium]